MGPLSRTKDELSSLYQKRTPVANEIHDQDAKQDNCTRAYSRALFRRSSLPNPSVKRLDSSMNHAREQAPRGAIQICFIDRLLPTTKLNVGRVGPIHAGLSGAAGQEAGREREGAPMSGEVGAARARLGAWSAGPQCQAPAAWTAWPVRSCSASRATLCASHATHEGNVEPWAQRSIFAVVGKLNSEGSR